MAIEVLIVDEDEDVLDITEAFLGRQDGLSVATEKDPESALERVTSAEFDAVVSDLTMPKLDGLELCEKLRESHPGIPFLVFTGREEGNIDRPDVSCPTGYVKKSTGTEQYEELADRIRSAL